MATDNAIDVLYDLVDNRLCAGDFRAVDVLCRHWTKHIGDYDAEMLVAMAIITLAARDKLEARAAFIEAAHGALGDEADEILRGLAP